MRIFSELSASWLVLMTRGWLLVVPKNLVGSMLELPVMYQVTILLPSYSRNHFGLSRTPRFIYCCPEASSSRFALLHAGLASLDRGATFVGDCSVMPGGIFVGENLFQHLDGPAYAQHVLPHRRGLLLQFLERSLAFAELGLQLLEPSL